MTYTYVILEISKAAYVEIKDKLHKAGYDHTFHEDEGRIVIDMAGIALAAEVVPNETKRKTRPRAR